VTTANLGSNNGDAPVIIRNNISNFYFLSNEKGSFVGQIRAGNSTIASKIDASHNLVYGPQVCSSEFPGCVEVGSRITAPPVNVFQNPASPDLRLKPGSPAIDKGFNVGFVSEDIDGKPRPAGNAPDIGTYEFN
jgi:hypothetical protein